MIVREYINEVFTDESDPINDIGIGLRFIIEKWLKKYNILSYTINNDMSINVNGYLNLSGLLYGNFPKYINFNHVFGDVNIAHCKLTSLRGCPKTIDGWFSCDNNKLKTLKYGPKEVQLKIHKLSNYECNNNKLASLTGLPKILPGNLWCFGNAKIFTKKYLKKLGCTVNGEIRFK